MTNVTEDYLPTTPEVNILLKTQYRVYDGLLAAGLCLCFLVGFPGNCLSLIYFIRTKKRNLPSLLYITACLIDIVSCVIHLPVAVNLLNKRSAGLFENKVFCSVWPFLFTSIQLMSMFVVMMLSLTRTIVIVFPFYKIRKKTVLASILLVFLCVFIGNSIVFSKGHNIYSRFLAYCVHHASGSVNFVFYMTIYSAWLGVIPLIVFSVVSIAIFKLRAQKRLQLNDFQKNRQEASITMVYFAVVFLVCNFLTFMTMVLISAEILGKNSMYFHKHPFMMYYSIPIGQVFCTVFNATVNPIFYVLRFKDMKVWLQKTGLPKMDLNWKNRTKISAQNGMPPG